MTKLNIINKHRNLYLKYYKNELQFLLYKSIYLNRNIKFYFRQYIYYEYIQKFKLKNNKLFCLLTGNSRSRYSYFGLNRIKLRDLASNKVLVGLRKAS
jgi:ribosomal protein S14